MTLSGRDEFRVREAVKATESRTTPIRKIRKPAIVMPTMGRAARDIAGNELGEFNLLANTPGDFVELESTRWAYPMCAVTVGTQCALLPMTGPASGGYWAAIPCSASQNAGTFACAFAEGGEMPQVTLTITGLVDNASYPEFDGWAAKIARADPWELRHDNFQIANTFPEGLLGLPPGKVSPCQPGLEWSVPDDKNGQTASGPFGVRLTSIVSGVGVLEVPASIHLEFYAGAIDNAFGPQPIRLFWREGVGANRFPRDADEKGQYDQTYALWVKPGSIAGAVNERFRAWLDAATITLN